MTDLNGPSYSGPALDAAVHTRDEVETGQVTAPAGTTPYVIGPGQNLSQIAEAHGTTLQQLLIDNPQYSLNPQQDGGGTRDADLIYPGEVVFVAATPGSDAGTLAAARELVDANALSVGNDSQATNKDNQLAAAGASLESAVRAEIAAGGDPTEIQARLLADPTLAPISDQVPAIVDRATTAASPTNPVGGAGDNAPFSATSATNRAALAWSEAQAYSPTTDSQATHHQDLLDGASQTLAAAVQAELAQGVDINEIKARYGDDPAFNAAIDAAAAG